MTKMLKILEDVGLTHGEAKVYLALLETGQSTSGPIVKKSGVSASKVYEILNKLVAKGLASTVTKEGTKYFSVTNPAKLSDYVDEKEKQIKKQKEEVERIMPYLQEKLVGLEEGQYAEVTMGFRGLVNLANKLIEGGKKGDDYVFFSFYTKDPERFEKVYDFYKDFDEVRRKRGLGVKGIVPKGIEKYTSGRRYAKLCFVDFPVPTNIAVCGNKVLLTPWEKEPVNILIYSEQLAESFRSYFYSIFNKHYKRK